MMACRLHRRDRRAAPWLMSAIPAARIGRAIRFRQQRDHWPSAGVNTRRAILTNQLRRAFANVGVSLLADPTVPRRTITGLADFRRQLRSKLSFSGILNLEMPPIDAKTDYATTGPIPVIVMSRTAPDFHRLHVDRRSFSRARRTIPSPEQIGGCQMDIAGQGDLHQLVARLGQGASVALT